MNSLLALVDTVNGVFKEKLGNGSLLSVNGKELGLDERTGQVYIDLNDRLVIVHKSADNKLRYYGGYEYVEPGHIAYLGEYVMYSEESERVAKSLALFEAEMERKNNLADVDKSSS